MENSQISQLKTEVKKELINNILPYWMGRMVDVEHGGFYGRISGDDELFTLAEKGGILNARILWTFSSAYGLVKDPIYLQIAERSKDYILKYFFDEEFGGTYWSLTFDNKPLDTKKQIYSIAFFIYALSEYHRVTGDETSLKKAIELFKLIEKHSFDKNLNGYFEAYSRDWKLLEDLRLSEKDANEKKTMNTHLHVLEAYTNLYRVWKDEGLAKQLKNLIIVFLDNIVDNRTFHLNLFFDENWISKAQIISYGHDIEASWLLDEAARVLEDQALLKRTQEICIKIAHAASEGLQMDGSLIYEKNEADGHLDKDRHWWPQAEAVVGFLNAFELTNDTTYLKKATECWKYIKNTLIDKKAGEWYWSVTAEGKINRKDDKAGFWKCPYHNGRMCLEVLNR